MLDDTNKDKKMLGGDHTLVLDEVETEEEAEPVAPLPRKLRDRTISYNKLRLLSEQKESDPECETCRTAATYASKKGLPVIVKNSKLNCPPHISHPPAHMLLFRVALADAEAVENSWFNYLLSFRPVKWLRYMTIPWLLPLDLTVAGCTKFV